MVTGGWYGKIPRGGVGGGLITGWGESMGVKDMGAGNAWRGGPAQGGKLKVVTDGQQRTDHQGVGGRNSEGT